MISVTINGSFDIEPAQLLELLSVVGISGKVETAVTEQAADTTTPTSGTSAPSGTPVSAAPNTAPDKPKRKRRTKRQIEEDEAKAKAEAGSTDEPSVDEAAAADTAAAESGEAPAADETLSADALIERFSKLIDKDFEAAKGLLDELGVAKFSDLPEDEYVHFADALSNLGV